MGNVILINENGQVGASGFG